MVSRQTHFKFGLLLIGYIGNSIARWNRFATKRRVRSWLHWWFFKSTDKIFCNVLINILFRNRNRVLTVYFFFGIKMWKYFLLLTLGRRGARGYYIRFFFDIYSACMISNFRYHFGLVCSVQVAAVRHWQCNHSSVLYLLITFRLFFFFFCRSFITSQRL